MPKSSKRNRQIADSIQRELAMALQLRIRDPRLADVNITDIVLSPDLRHAKVYFILVKDSDLEAANTALANAAGRFRRILAENLELRYTPTLAFFYDETIVHAERLRELLKEADKSNETEKSDS